MTTETLELKELTNEQWSDLCDGYRPELPPCCDTLYRLASVIKTIRGFGYDLNTAKEVVRLYRLNIDTHDLTMFPALTLVVLNCIDIVQFHEPPEPAKGLAHYDEAWYQQHAAYYDYF